jgi:hypothetical protein
LEEPSCLEEIVTGGETRFFQCDPETKYQKSPKEKFRFFKTKKEA